MEKAPSFPFAPLVMPALLSEHRLPGSTRPLDQLSGFATRDRGGRKIVGDATIGVEMAAFNAVISFVVYKLLSGVD